MTTTKARQQDTVMALVADRWQAAAEKLARLAAEMPEDKLDATVVPGARTPAEVLRHVAFWNEYVAQRLKGEAADETANELPPERYPTKAAIATALINSNTAVATVLADPAAIRHANPAELVVPFVEHVCEHYGQLVAYSRLLGIVPPASRA